MAFSIPNQNVLVIATASEAAERLAARVSAAGEEPIVLPPRERLLLDRTDDDGFDLILTDLAGGPGESGRILERLIDGELFFGVPQLHLADGVPAPELAERMSDVASTAIEHDSDDGAIELRIRLACEIGRLRRDLRHAAIRDVLTNAYNRRFLLMRLSQEFARARRYETPLSVVVMHIDQLRNINHDHGTEAGDQAIRQLAELLQAQVRREDVSGRWGDTSFLAILPGTPYRGAAVFANKVRGDSESLTLEGSDGPLPFRLSAGISAFQPGSEMTHASELLQAAESALSEAKERGGNRVFIDQRVMRGESRYVAIADDDPRLLDTAEDLLALDDLRVMRAQSIDALFEACRLRRPDLIVVDLDLAGREEAPAIVHRLHELFPDSPVPIIGLATADSGDADLLDRIAVDRYITKPFSVNVLGAIARELITQRSPRRPAPAEV